MGTRLARFTIRPLLVALSLAALVAGPAAALFPEGLSATVAVDRGEGGPHLKLVEPPDTTIADVSIYDALGRRVVTLARGRFTAGIYTRRWSGLNAGGQTVGSGLYFCRLRTGDVVRVTRMIRLR